MATRLSPLLHMRYIFWMICLELKIWHGSTSTITVGSFARNKFENTAGIKSGFSFSVLEKTWFLPLTTKVPVFLHTESKNVTLQVLWTGIHRCYLTALKCCELQRTTAPGSRLQVRTAQWVSNECKCVHSEWCPGVFLRTESRAHVFTSGLSAN